MTVHVQTAEHGKKSYPHADGYQYDLEGFLNVLKDDEPVGTYPPGHWTGVAVEIPETGETVAEAQPAARVWKSIYDVPAGVHVRDRDGDVFVWIVPDDPEAVSELVWSFGTSDPLKFEAWDTDGCDTNSVDRGLHPFTEVLS